jgi:hypothetical protein
VYSNQQNQNYWQSKRGFRDPSIEVKSDWPTIAEIGKITLEKITPIVVKKSTIL